MQKETFLRSKGLTDAEVQMAFQQAGIFAKDPNNTIINMDITHQTPSLIPLHRTAPETTLQKIYHVISSTAIVAGVIYSIYFVYKVRQHTIAALLSQTSIPCSHSLFVCFSNTSNRCCLVGRKTTAT